MSPDVMDGKLGETTGQRVQHLADNVRPLFEPGQVIELRALAVKHNSTARPHIEAGFFDTDHLTALARCALHLTPKAKGVYFTLNPLKPELLYRRCNRIEWAEEGELAKDKDVLRRRWLLVDADPIRDAFVSATEEEKAAALDIARAVREHLAARGWPAPILADSGNGFHLLYRIDLDANDGGLVERILQALAARFNTDRVKIDTKVFNPARICKLPGTWARKGDNTPTRPHRWSKLLEVPWQ
jgi:hypothetical protein